MVALANRIVVRVNRSTACDSFSVTKLKFYRHVSGLNSGNLMTQSGTHHEDKIFLLLQTLLDFGQRVQSDTVEQSLKTDHGRNAQLDA